MVNNKSIPVHGRQIWWRGGDIESPSQSLRDAFAAAGCIPERRTAKALATAALADCYPAKDGWLIRPLARQADGSYGVEAVREVKGERANQYLDDERVSVRQISDRDSYYWQVASPYSDSRDRIRNAADAMADGWPQGHIAYALMRCIERSRGISLRDGGGVYWIPEGDGLARIERLAEELGYQGWTVYLPTLQADDPQAWKAVADAARDALIADSQALATRIQAGGLKDRALATAVQQCQEQVSRLEQYERIIGTSIDGARVSLAKAQSAVEIGLMASRSDSIKAGGVTAPVADAGLGEL